MNMNMQQQEVINYLLSNCKISVKILQHPNILAQVTVDFGVLKVKNFTIRAKDSKNWVNPPSYPTKKGGWGRIFWTEDAPFWRKLSELILAAFDNAIIEQSIQRLDSNNTDNLASKVREAGL